MADYNSAYTGAQIDAGVAGGLTAVPNTRTVNGKPLSADLSLDAADVGARSSTWTPAASDVTMADTSGGANVEAAISSLKSSVSSGKSAVAAAVTDMGVNTAADASFSTMAAHILAIPTGTDTSDATATAADLLAGKTAYAGGAKLTGTIASKSAGDLTASGAAVSVPAGYYSSAASKSVDSAAQAVPSVSIDTNGLITASCTQSAGYVPAGTTSGTKQLTKQTALSASNLTVTASAGYYPSAVSKTLSSSNLTAANIKSGVNIFGVTGTLSSTSVVTGSLSLPYTTSGTYTSPIVLSNAIGKSNCVFFASSCTNTDVAPYAYPSNPMFILMAVSCISGNISAFAVRGNRTYPKIEIISAAAVSWTASTGTWNITDSKYAFPSFGNSTGVTFKYVAW